MSSKDELVNTLSKQFSAFTTSSTEALKKVFLLQDREFQERLTETKNSLTSIISSKDSEIAALTSILSAQQSLKRQRTCRLYSLFSNSQNKRKLNTALSSWLSHFRQKKRSQKLNVYVSNFYRRSQLRKDFKNWKREAQEKHRERVVQATNEKIQEEIELATGKVNEESETLRRMICELTEDLRNETLARQQLKHKFEQAMLKGMSALNAETEVIQSERDVKGLSSSGHWAY